MIIRICDKCKATNIKTLVPKLKKINPELEIKIGCHNMCGVGRIKPFAIVNKKAFTAGTEDELIEKIKEEINQ